jgi:ribonucleoside-diphosphate reductase alpha chain
MSVDPKHTYSAAADGASAYIDIDDDSAASHTGGATYSHKKKSPENQKLEITANARTVLERRYLKKDDNNKVCETPEDMFRRVAHNIASADVFFDPNADVQATEEKFLKMLLAMDFVPNSPTLMNAGRDLQQLSACFVLPVEDSMEDIFETVKNTALIHKSGGGPGFSFSRLRPKNSAVRSTRGASSGPVSFMQVFNSATEIIKQGGTRRGANMGILRVDHPDILDFISCKKENDKLTNFNISVAVTDAFMRSAEEGTKYELVDPHTGKVTSELDARTVFKEIVSMAYSNGEPGIIFIDKINAGNPTPHIGAIESTNPCGEQPLLPYESCNLGSINLSKMVTNGKIDFPKLKKTVHASVHFLDNVIDMNRYPLDKIGEMTKSNRKIGLGVMGFADMLIAIGLPYDSEEAVAVAEKSMKFIRDEARSASIDLAEKRGAFPNFENSIFDVPGAPKIRNATTTTIAPTGTISIIANCSSGVEPLFAVYYTRKVMDKDELVEVNPHFKKIAHERGFFSPELLKRIAKAGSIQEFDEIPKDVRRQFVTAHDITPEWHVRIQAAFQKYTDNAVSKTVNFSHDATVDDVEKAYMLAYKSDCKGLTIYRDGSREDQVLSVKKETEKAVVVQAAPVAPVAVTPPGPRERPSVTYGRTERIVTGCGNFYVTVNEDKCGPNEVFTQMGKAGGCAAAQSEALSRIISLCLRSGVKPDQVVKHLRGIRCHSPSWENGGMIHSCPDALGIVIDRYLRWKETGSSHTEAVAKIERYSGSSPDVFGSCPDCGSVVEHEGGCVVCRICGFSRCS